MSAMPRTTSPATALHMPRVSFLTARNTMATSNTVATSFHRRRPRELQREVLALCRRRIPPEMRW